MKEADACPEETERFAVVLFSDCRPSFLQSVGMRGRRIEGEDGKDSDGRRD